MPTEHYTTRHKTTSNKKIVKCAWVYDTTQQDKNQALSWVI